MDNGYVLFFSSGAQAGVFSAGVGAGLIEAEFERRYKIDAI